MKLLHEKFCTEILKSNFPTTDRTPTNIENYDMMRRAEEVLDMLMFPILATNKLIEQDSDGWRDWGYYKCYNFKNHNLFVTCVNWYGQTSWEIIICIDRYHGLLSKIFHQQKYLETIPVLKEFCRQFLESLESNRYVDKYSSFLSYRPNCEIQHIDEFDRLDWSV